MVFSRIATHDQHHVSVLDVNPAIGHCAASECGPQTGDRWTVSNTGLVFQVADPQAAHSLYDQIVEFVSVSAAAVERDILATVHGLAVFVLLDEALVARLLDVTPDLFIGL